MPTTPVAATGLEKRLDEYTHIGCLFAVALVTMVKRVLNVGRFNLPAEAGQKGYGPSTWTLGEADLGSMTSPSDPEAECLRLGPDTGRRAVDGRTLLAGSLRESACTEDLRESGHRWIAEVARYVELLDDDDPLLDLLQIVADGRDPDAYADEVMYEALEAQAEGTVPRAAVERILRVIQDIDCDLGMLGLQWDAPGDSADPSTASPGGS